MTEDERRRQILEEAWRIAKLELRLPKVDRNGSGIVDDVDDGSWAETLLAEWLDGEHPATEPTILKRDDGQGIFYPGCVNWLFADSGEGKSMVSAITTAQEVKLGHHVLWIDLEEPTPITLIERLRMLGVGNEAIKAYVHRIAPRSEFTDPRVDRVIEIVNEHEITTAVIDSLGEAFGLDGIDEDRDKEVGPWLRRVVRRLADTTGVCVIVIDHSTKAKENRLFPSGSKRKRAAVTGHSVLVEAVTSLTKERGGKLRLTCSKDRHGNFERGKVVATVDMFVYPDLGVSVKVWPPFPADEHAPDERLRVVARAAVRAVKEVGRSLSQSELVALMKVKASTDLKRAGIDTAVADGAIRIDKGERNALMHVYVHDLTEPKK